MKAFQGYEEVKVNNYGERLKLGGHICKILEAKIEQLESKKDGKKYEQLVIKFDIESPDEQAGFYADKFASDARTDALNAKWKGYHKISVPTDESEDFIKSNFKTFTTSVEDSNPGYKWNWDENTLVGKTFGGVFGIEEFTLDDGRTLSMTKIRFIRGTGKINEAQIPKVKLADKTFMDYNEYIAKKKAEREGNNKQNSTNNNLENSTINGDDLPF
ncbi:MAG: hypothetical protein ACI4VQ_07975 [Clostridia bacterium]